MLHHKHTNDPNKDPDIGTKSKNFIHSLWVCGVLQRQPNAGYGLQSDFYKKNIAVRHCKSILYFSGFIGFY